jgi:hypothetical protein
MLAGSFPCAKTVWKNWTQNQWGYRDDEGKSLTGFDPIRLILAKPIPRIPSAPLATLAPVDLVTGEKAGGSRISISLRTERIALKMKDAPTLVPLRPITVTVSFIIGPETLDPSPYVRAKLAEVFTAVWEIRLVRKCDPAGGRECAYGAFCCVVALLASHGSNGWHPKIRGTRVKILEISVVSD